MKQALVPVVSINEIMRGIHLVWIKAPYIADAAQPGQFVTVRCGEDVLLRRPLSIHRIERDKVALLFSIVGQGTEWLAKRMPGESLDILGPLGNGFKIHRDSKNILLVAGGIGIAPLVFLADKAKTNGLSVKLIAGAATASQLFTGVEGVELIRVTEDGSVGHPGMVTDIVPPHVQWADQIFACGPIPMYRAMANRALEFKGIPVQIILEQMMGCGVGACRGCAVPTIHGMKMVCSDGPVFDLGELKWEAVIAPGVSQFRESD